MSDLTPQSIAERKSRERMTVLALPPAEAQRMISLNLTKPFTILSDPEVDFSSGLEEHSFFDEMVDKQ